MTNIITTINLFDGDYELNTVAQQVLDLETGFKNDVKAMNKYAKSAMQRRWEMGKVLYDNEELIVERLGSQKAFAEKLGSSEGTLSNNKRGYANLLEHGCTTWEEVMELLEKKELPANTYTFERMGKLLNDPTATDKIKDQRPKDEKRLEQITKEVEEIVQRNETSNHNTFELGKQVLKDVLEVGVHIGKVDPYKSTWRSKNYLEFVRNLGMDFITMTPEDAVDPHHTLQTQEQRMGSKVADVFTIPVSRDIHMMIENGTVELTQEEISDALIRTMALFIIHNFK